jgi:ubiquinone/menaquinone biosynthesis C-methylase UbiE
MAQSTKGGFFKNKFRNFLYNSASLYALKKGINERFMNLGYVGSPIELKEEDKHDTNHFQLYNTVTKGVDFKNKELMEVGCGRGGGCYFLKEYLKAAKVTGVDLSANNIKIANKLVGSEDVTFSRQNAEEINFPPASLDGVVNLESSHCYPNRKAFYKGVYSLLKSGGYFVYADIMMSNNVSRIREYICSLGFKLERETDITEGVVLSLQEKQVKRFSFLKKKIIPLILKSFYVSNEGYAYAMLKEGKRKYMSFVFSKNP